MAREILARGAREPRVHRPGDGRLRGVPRSASSSTRSSTPSGRRACRRRRSATSRTRTRRRRPAQLCWTLGITEHHNAVDNVFALINLVAPDRPRRPLGLGRLPAARTEQRPGRRRHGRAAQQAARRPGRRGSGLAREVRTRLGRVDPAEEGHAPLADVRGDGARQAAGALRHRREPGAVGSRPEARDPACSRGSTTSSCRTCS